jgi:ATP dependent DNA ligase domain/DNA ligase OB-like domain
VFAICSLQTYLSVALLLDMLKNASYNGNIQRRSTMIHEIFNKLAAESSTKVKSALLTENKDNALLRKIFEMALNPFYNYYVTVSDYPESLGTAELSVEVLDDVLSTLNGRRLTGNAAKDYLASLMVQLIPSHQELLKNIINRDMNCKVAGGLVNRTWPDLIPEFPCMLAEKYDEKTVVGVPEGQDAIIVQKKEDGGRVAIVVSDDCTVTFYSRNGNVLLTHGYFDAFFNRFPGNVFDGELLVVDQATGTQDRKTSNGIFNKAVRGTVSIEEVKKFHMVLWDHIPLEQWKSGYCATPYAERLKTLLNFSSSIPQHIASVVPTKFVSYHYQVQKFYEEMLASGFEGAMVKRADGHWENRRSKLVLKLKETKDATLLCVGVKPHSKNSNMIGSIECRTSDGKLEVSIGSGLTEADRLKPSDYYIGKLIDVKYNMLIKDKNSTTHSMFLPRYNGIRTDQNQADVLDHLT